MIIMKKMQLPGRKPTSQGLIGHREIHFATESYVGWLVVLGLTAL